MRSSRSLSAFYFFALGALGSFFPFLPLLLTARGLDNRAIAWVLVVAPVANLIVPPLWGIIADACRARLTLLRIAAVGSAGAMLLFLPNWHLVGTLIAMAILSFFRMPLTTLADAAAVHSLGNDRSSYGRIRVWGSVGFAAFSLFMGLVHGSRAAFVFVVVPALAYCAACATTLPLHDSRTRQSHRRSAFSGALTSVRDPTLVLIMAGSALHYFAHGGYDAFFSLHVRTIGLHERFVGTAWAVGIVVEIGFMLSAKKLLNRHKGESLLAWASLGASLRWFMLSVFVNPVLILASQTLHGVSFGLWYVALVHTVQQRAPEALRSSFQAIAMASIGVGTVTGYIAAGYVLDSYSSPVLFRMDTVVAILAAALYASSSFLQSRREHASISNIP